MGIGPSGWLLNDTYGGIELWSSTTFQKRKLCWSPNPPCLTRSPCLETRSWRCMWSVQTSSPGVGRQVSWGGKHPAAQGGGRGVAESEVEALQQLQARECHGLPTTPEGGETWWDSALWVCEGASAWQYSGFWLTAFRTVKQQISAILRQPVCDTWSQQS